MKYLKLFEEIDFDDWDWEEEEPFDFNSFIINDVYKSLKNYKRLLDWLNGNIVGKTISVYNPYENNELTFENIIIHKFLPERHHSVLYPKEIVIEYSVDDSKIFNNNEFDNLYFTDKIVINKLNESIDFDDWDYEEEEPIKNFTYVKGHSGGSIYLSLNEIRDGNSKLFNGKFTSGWKPYDFIPLDENEIDDMINGRPITIYDKNDKLTGEILYNSLWKIVHYDELIKIYPQFKI